MEREFRGQPGMISTQLPNLIKSGVTLTPVETHGRGWDDNQALVYRSQLLDTLQRMADAKTALANAVQGGVAPTTDRQALELLSRGLDDYFRTVATLVAREDYWPK